MSPRKLHKLVAPWQSPPCHTHCKQSRADIEKLAKKGELAVQVKVNNRWKTSTAKVDSSDRAINLGARMFSNNFVVSAFRVVLRKKVKPDGSET